MFRFRRIGLRPCISLIMTLHAEICRNGSFASLSNTELFGVMEAHVPQREVLFEGHPRSGPVPPRGGCSCLSGAEKHSRADSKHNRFT